MLAALFFHAFALMPMLLPSAARQRRFSPPCHAATPRERTLIDAPALRVAAPSSVIARMRVKSADGATPRQSC